MARKDPPKQCDHVTWVDNVAVRCQRTEDHRGKHEGYTSEGAKQVWR